MPETFDRRTLLRRGAFGAAGLAAASVGPRNLLDSTIKAPRNGISSARPRRGGSLVFAVEAEQSALDPATGRFDESGVNYARSYYDPLTIIAADGSIQPYLAESVTPDTDYSVWTINVRPGVSFHDGTPCDGPAVANSMNHYIGGLLGIVTMQPVQSVVATGPMTVTVTLKQPWIPFPYYLAGGIGGQVGYVVGPAEIAQAKNPNAQVHPVGTGPFIFKEWVPNDHLTVARNPNYWRGGGLPYLDQITFRPIPDPESRQDSLLAGTVDIMHTDVATTILHFENDASYGFVDDLHKVIGEPDIDFVMLNVSVPPMNDPRVRQAMAMAQNLKEYKSVINHGVNPVSTNIFTKGSPFYASTSYPSYDPAKAKALIQQVRAETGKEVSFTLGTTTSPLAVQAAEFSQAAFEAAGMKVQLATFQQSELIDNALTGKFQAYGWRQFGAVDPDLNYLFWSPTTIFGPPINEASNFSRNTDPEVETYLQLGRRSSDPSVRAEAYQGVAERFAKDLPFIYTDRAVWSIISNSKVQNWNNPTTPAGAKAYGMIVGTIWPTQIWMAS